MGESYDRRCISSDVNPDRGGLRGDLFREDVSTRPISRPRQTGARAAGGTAAQQGSARSAGHGAEAKAAPRCAGGSPTGLVCNRQLWRQRRRSSSFAREFASLTKHVMFLMPSNMGSPF